MGNYHARCGAGEKPEVATPEAYLSLLPLPDGFCSLLSTCRSREISNIIIIQNLAQIKELFEKTWETIPGNCDTLIYLGGNEQSTHKYLSESLGKGTIDKKSSGETRGKSGSSSRNYDVLGRELLTPDETRKLDNNSCILLIRGCDAIIDRKFNTFKHPLFGETEDGGAKPYIHDIESARKEEKLRFLSEESLKYYEEKAKKGEAVHILELTMDEVFAYNPVPEKIFSDEELEENRKAVRRSVKEVVRKKEKVPDKKKEQVQTDEEKLSELLKKHPYSGEQLEEIFAAVESNVPYEKILSFADIRNSADKMRELRLRYTKDTAN